jgi:hypothetical protein
MCRRRIIDHPPLYLIKAQFWQTLNYGNYHIISARRSTGLETPWQPG